MLQDPQADKESNAEMAPCLYVGQGIDLIVCPNSLGSLKACKVHKIL